MQLVFVGTQAAIMDTPFQFDRFGQRVEMPDQLAAEKIQDVPLIPAADFDAIGFTNSELSAYSDPETWRSAPESFLSKQRAAWQALHEYRGA